MIDEIAVEPEYLNTWDRVRFILDQCGIEFGRLISDFPSKKWCRLVMEACKDCGPVEKTRITERLRQVKSKLIRKGRVFLDQEDWVANARREHKSQPFHLIVVKDSGNHGGDFVEGGNLDATLPQWQVRTNDVIPRRAAAMCSRAAELLRLSKQVVLVDPHFSVKPVYTRTLSGFLRRALEGGAQVVRLEFHLKAKAPQEHFLQKLKTDLRKRLPSLPACGIRFIRWKSIPEAPGDSMHARYILTDVGGLRFDYGLCESAEEGVTTDVALFSKTSEVYTRRWSDYQASSSAFSFEDGFEVTRGGIKELRIQNGEFVTT